MNEVKGLVFNIVRGSMVDGYGVRTTVFLKGCPMKCLWCCNVEGQSYVPELKVTEADCNGCGNCVAVCPENAIDICVSDSKVKLKADRRRCTNCMKCIDVCYTGALSRFGDYYTADEVMLILKRDIRYYSHSGGGVTIGGGEPTAQADFTLELIRKCREANIHVALDTCGLTTSDLGYQCLSEADLLLYDIKHLTSDIHKDLTGSPNEKIIDNLKRLDASGQHIIVRIPVIPSYNDSRENLNDIAKLLSGLKSLERLDLIGYHNYSMMKYEQLGREYPMTIPAAGETYMKDVLKLFTDSGINAQLGG